MKGRALFGEAKSVKTDRHQEDPRSCLREFWAGVSEVGFGSSCSGQVQAPWKIVLRGGHSLESRMCWDKGSMCESLVFSLQPSSGRLEFGETRGGYPGFR